MRSISFDASRSLRREAAPDTVHHLGIDTVAVHVLDPQVRVGAASDILLAILVHPGLGHLVDPVVLTRNKRRATRPDTVLQPEIGAILGNPLWPVRAILDIRHPVL